MKDLNVAKELLLSEKEKSRIDLSEVASFQELTEDELEFISGGSIRES